MSGVARHPSRRRRPPKMFLVPSDLKIMDHLDGTIRVPRGCLCQEQETQERNGRVEVWVKVLDTGGMFKIDRQKLIEIPADQSNLLEPVKDLEARLKLHSKPHRLQRLALLPMGSPVTVVMSQESLAEGELRFRGPLTRGSTAVYFGVQLKGWAAGKGTCNGSYKGHQLFTCPEACGIFVSAGQITTRRSSREIDSKDYNNHNGPLPPSNFHNAPGSQQQQVMAPPSSHHHQQQPVSILSRTAESVVQRPTSPTGPLLQQGQRVMFAQDDVTQTGKVAFCGPLPGRTSGGVYVGVVLDNPVGNWDGTYKNHKLCSIPSPQFGHLLPLSKVTPVESRREKSPPPVAVVATKPALKPPSLGSSKVALVPVLPPYTKPALKPVTAPKPVSPVSPTSASSPNPALPSPVLSVPPYQPKTALQPPSKQSGSPPPLPPPSFSTSSSAASNNSNSSKPPPPPPASLKPSVKPLPPPPTTASPPYQTTNHTDQQQPRASKLALTPPYSTNNNTEQPSRTSKPPPLMPAFPNNHTDHQPPPRTSKHALTPLYSTNHTDQHPRGSTNGLPGPPSPPSPEEVEFDMEAESPGAADGAVFDTGTGFGLEVGSMVEVNEPPQYGVIRWIGRISGIPELVAGVELDQEITAGTDGSYLSERYFRCPANKGLFVKLRSCRRDSRFPVPEMPINQVERCNSIAFADWGSERVEEHTAPVRGPEARQHYQGWKKGIQGHLNSCYLDASLFSLFSCCSSADSVLFCPPGPQDGPHSRNAQDLLRCEIVNPLRRNGYVCASKTMALRKLLEAETTDAGFTNQEKDPEEFLNKLFQLLRMEPLLRIRSMNHQPQQCHIYQLFPPSTTPSSPLSPFSPSLSPAPLSPIPLSPPSGHMRVASVQALLEASFIHSGLKFTEAPSCLPLLMPRFGKDFKMFDAILPSLTLDITDLLDESLRQCSICQSLAHWECVQCYEDQDITPGRLKQFCHTCNTQVHTHKKRISHQPERVRTPQCPWAETWEGLNGNSSSSREWEGPLGGSRQRLELFAVTCIETSHYVSFVRYGPQPTDWLFFDSMADREGGENGFNVPQVRACPEVGRYLSLSEEEVRRLDPASLKDTVRRLLCDSYMCLYHCPEISLYK
ncbi:ubiquitin carboxyl-terminal hydrolase CYLD-like isoform X2 [Engraulis encrasicolus]|uniref:ubiquitin carboxyl-terminal hydrolase CYLD-like isoform X2 n=1 Tax=Engraulis encrasicolus TaxID=184585 RepID=UPI002FD527FD